MKPDSKPVIAVSGWTGLIGSELCAALADGFAIRTVGRSESSDLVADFGDQASVRRLNLADVRVFIHCAGVVDEDLAADPARAYLRSTLAVESLMENCVRAGVRKFVYFSTSHVYGPPRGRIDENTGPNPLSRYAIAHFAAEQIIRRFTQGGKIRALVLRPNAVYGIPRNWARFRRWHLIPFSFPREAVLRQEIVLRSTGKQRRNFVSTSDLAAVVRYVLSNDDLDSWMVMNPVGRDTLSVRGFAELCAQKYRQISGRECYVRCAPDASDESGEDFEYSTKFEFSRGTSSVENYVEAVIQRLLTEGENIA
jgi:UDP-glucose 4-epimerase